ncbi:MAG: TadE/TadG family type IV pilus assembly protein [Alphaproteobacteria bacterium]
MDIRTVVKRLCAGDGGNKKSGFLDARVEKFLANRRGNVAVIFALALLPILSAAGSAVDITRALQVKARLSSALDAAGLAAGKKIDSDDATIIATAQAYFNANYPAAALGVPGDLVVDISDNTITLRVTASVETTIMRIMGFDEILVASDTEISRAVTGLEVALALDNTGSMAGAKLADLKSASHELMDILFGDETMPEHLKISLVPFAAGVNVGPAFNTAWLDMAGASSIHSENFTAGTNLWTLFSNANLTNRDWNGCLMERPGSLDEEDTPPTPGSPDTFFVPWLAPDEPNSPTGYSNSYLSDGSFPSGTSAANKQKSTAKYVNASVSSTSRGPDYNCRNTQIITPLTNDRNLLDTRIDEMVAAYLTHIPVGLAWGWRTLSPGAPYMEGSLYTDEDTIKALVLMTDGENTIQGGNNHNLSAFTAYGFLAKQRLGTNNESTAVTRLDQKTARLCTNVKAAGIRVYTIAFQVSDTTTLNLLRDCATAPENFFPSSSGAALSTAFRAIATELASLRISR